MAAVACDRRSGRISRRDRACREIFEADDPIGGEWDEVQMRGAHLADPVEPVQISPLGAQHVRGLSGLGDAGLQLGVDALARSEEHTFELQSLMRISYAVFCLTKKTTKNKMTQKLKKNTSTI